MREVTFSLRSGLAATNKPRPAPPQPALPQFLGLTTSEDVKLPGTFQRGDFMVDPATRDVLVCVSPTGPGPALWSRLSDLSEACRW